MEEQQRAQGNKFRRYLWHLNRTPARHLVKAGVRLAHLPQVVQRRAMARRFDADPRIAALATAFQRDGYVALDSIVDRSALLELDAVGKEKLRRAADGAVGQVLSHKAFWTRLLDEDMIGGKLPTDNPCVRFAMQRSIVALLSRILGEVPRLDYVLLTLSRSSNTPLSYSQLWHRDHDDIRTIKMFVYLTDVNGIDDGPFTFLPRPVSDRDGFSLKSHRGDETIGRFADRKEWKAIVAPRLSVFLVETSRCLHMGSRVAPGHERLLYTATYITAGRMFPEPASPFAMSGESDEIARLLLNA